MGAAAALGRCDVHHPADGMRAIQRGSRASHELSPLSAHKIHVAVECRRIPLGAGCIAESQAVNQDGRVMVPQASRLHCGETPRPAQLPDPDSGDRPESLRESELVAIGDLA